MDRNALRALIPDETRLRFGEDIAPEYLSDTLGRLRGKASALVFVRSTEEVSAVMKYAYARNIPVTPRGAGTNLVGSTVPLDGGIILDLSQMNRVLELDADTMTVTVEPGLLLQDLQAYVEARGLFYPPDPGEKTASIGGNISTNAGGMRAVKYGVTRDYVRGLDRGAGGRHGAHRWRQERQGRQRPVAQATCSSARRARSASSPAASCA